MSERVDLLITPLATNHHRAGFQCGVNALDDYLHKQAGQDVKRRVSRVFVATTLEQPDVITGYYTLSSLSIEFGQLPEKLARRLPRHPLPAALLGRLAISQDAQGRGIGGLLLADAIKRTLAVSNQIAIYALVVDVIDDQVRGFYEQYGFLPLGSNSRRLFLPLQSF
ncbi:GNAT family N-acetyltransferase [Pseudomonas lopnurensis]|uniref:GNAT family N-acetyltransferase n=1 Tax=Pseudomonas lopnurensis TaxID=1477517 RepID=UPI0028A73693|nr:GNAT family N-acetyltransferase [Pseudomonas lopnurensis]